MANGCLRQEENSLEGLAGSHRISGGREEGAEEAELKWMEAVANSFNNMNSLVVPYLDEGTLTLSSFSVCFLSRLKNSQERFS